MIGKNYSLSIAKSSPYDESQKELRRALGKVYMNLKLNIRWINTRLQTLQKQPRSRLDTRCLTQENFLWTCDDYIRRMRNLAENLYLNMSNILRFDYEVFADDVYSQTRINSQTINAIISSPRFSNTYFYNDNAIVRETFEVLSIENKQALFFQDAGNSDLAEFTTLGGVFKYSHRLISKKIRTLLKKQIEPFLFGDEELGVEGLVQCEENRKALSEGYYKEALCAKRAWESVFEDTDGARRELRIMESQLEAELNLIEKVTESLDESVVLEKRDSFQKFEFKTYLRETERDTKNFFSY